MRGRWFLGIVLYLVLGLLMVREFVHRWSTYYEHGSLRPPYAVLHPAYRGDLALWIDPVPCTTAPGCTTVVHRTAADIVQETADILAWEARLWHYFRRIETSHDSAACPPATERARTAYQVQADLVVVLDLMPPKATCCPTLRRLLGYLGIRPLRRGYRISYPASGPGTERSRCLAVAVDSLLQLAGFAGFYRERVRAVEAQQEPRLAPYASLPTATVLLELAPCDSDYEKVLQARWIRRWMMRTLLAGITAYLSRSHQCGVDPRVFPSPSRSSGPDPAPATTVRRS